MSNQTLPLHYTQTQKAFLPIACVPCVVICFLLYRFGRASNSNPEFRFDRKIQFLNALAAGLAFGQFLFHSYPETPGAIGVLAAALFVMLCIEKLSRVWHSHYHYTAPAAGVQEIRDSVDMEKMEARDYVHWKDMEDMSGREGVWYYEDEYSESKRRSTLAVLIYLTLIIYTVLEGFSLQQLHPTQELGNDPGLRVAMFYIHKALETLLVFITIIYALWQTSRRGRIAFFLLTLLWTISIALSPLPTLLNMPTAQVEMVMDFPLTWIVHSVLGGVLLWIAIMFSRIDLRMTDTRDTIWQLVLLALGLGLTCMTSFFI